MNKIIILMMVLFTLSLSAKVNKMTILDFDNNSGVRKYNSLGKGLADMLTTDLTYVKGLRIVEREKLRAIMREMNLSKSKYISRKSMLKLGKGLAANWILKGSFVTMKGRMRIDISIMSTETGEIVDSASVEGWVTKFFELEKRLIRRIIKAVHTKENRLTYTPKKRKEIKDFKIVLQYSKAVKLFDENKFKESEEVFRELGDLYYSDKYLKSLYKKIKKLKLNKKIKEENAKKKIVKDFLDKFEKLKKNEDFCDKAENAVSAVSDIDSKDQDINTIKLFNYIKNNTDKSILKSKECTFFLKQSAYIESHHLKFLRQEYLRISNKRTKNLLKLEGLIIQRAEAFIKKYPEDFRSLGTVAEQIEEIVNYRSKYKENQEKKEEESIVNKKKYKEIKKKLLKNLKKSFRKNSESLSLKIERRTDYIKQEMTRREEIIERGKKGKIKKEKLLELELRYNNKIKSMNDYLKSLELRLKNLPLKMQKDAKKDLLLQALKKKQYKEFYDISKNLLLHRNLTDYEKLEIYEILLNSHNVSNNFNSAIKLYKKIKKDLVLPSYEEKYLKTKKFQEYSKKLKSINYKKEIEDIKNQINEGDLNTKLRNKLRDKKRLLENDYEKINRYIRNQEDEFELILKKINKIEILHNESQKGILKLKRLEKINKFLKSL